MLEPVAPLRVRREPRAHDEHSRGVDDRIEGLVGSEARADAERAIEALRNVLDRDLVGQRPIVPDMDRGDVIAAIDERAAPWLE
jgi:hypothetical protein